jgi:hypothetical protein
MTTPADFIVEIARAFSLCAAKGSPFPRMDPRYWRVLGSAAYAVRTGSVAPKSPAFGDSKKRPMVLALWPPVRAIRVRSRKRYDYVLMRVPACDGRGVTRFVRGHANQHRARECTDNPPHDVPLLSFRLVRRLGHCHNSRRRRACQWGYGVGCSR